MSMYNKLQYIHATWLLVFVLSTESTPQNAKLISDSYGIY